MAETAILTIECNPPKRFGSSSTFIFGIKDEMLTEGRAGETVYMHVPYGVQDITVLVRNSGIDSMTGVTQVEVSDDMSFRIKYGLFNKTAKLALKK